MLLLYSIRSSYKPSRIDFINFTGTRSSVSSSKKVAYSPVNVSTSYVLGVYFVGSRHPF